MIVALITVEIWTQNFFDPELMHFIWARKYPVQMVPFGNKNFLISDQAGKNFSSGKVPEMANLGKARKKICG